MEKGTRERLTGAVILVILLPIVVDEVLTGPGRDRKPAADVVAEEGPPLTTYDLALDSSSGAASARQRELAGTTAIETEAIAQAVPPPVTEPPRVSLPESRPPARQSEPAPPAAPEAQPRAPQSAPTAERPAAAPPSPASSRTPAPPPAAAAGGRWWVQLGSFSSQENSQRLARDLRGKGFTIEVSTVRSGDRELHRVRAGPESDRGRAVALRDRLAAAGQQGSLVAP